MSILDAFKIKLQQNGVGLKSFKTELLSTKIYYISIPDEEVKLIIEPYTKLRLWFLPVSFSFLTWLFYDKTFYRWRSTRLKLLRFNTTYKSFTLIKYLSTRFINITNDLFTNIFFFKF